MAVAETRWWGVCPLDIADLRSDPRVLDLSPAARGGFVWLLLAQWDAEDGYLPANEEFARQASMLREEWPDHKRAVLTLFTLTGDGLAYPPLRERWEERMALHLRQSEAAKRTNARSQPSEERAGERGGDRGSAENRDSLYVVEECIGSLKRASKGATEENEYRTPQLAETSSRRSAEASGTEARSDCQAGTAAEEMSPPPTVQEQGGSCHEARVELESSFGSIVAPTPSMMARWPEDEKRGAAVRPTSSQARHGAPVRPPEPVSEDSEPETDDDADFLEAQRLAAMGARRAGAGTGRSAW